MEKLLSDKKYAFISQKDKAFIVAFNGFMAKAGYANNGIQPYVVFGKYKIEYFKPGNKTKKYIARIYFREEAIVLRLYFSNIDKHRRYIEQSPGFIKKPFVDDSHRCKPGCKGMAVNDTCRYRKTYTLDGAPYVKCAEQSFMYYNMSAENASKYVELLTQFYPNTMSKATYPVETVIRALSYKGVGFEVVGRPDAIWAGCVGYAENNTGEPDIGATLKRFQALVASVPIKEKINPGWSASLSINYGCGDKPSGIMFANESRAGKQDGRYDILTQPGGLWLRVCVSAATDTALLGRQNYGMFEYFGILKDVARENGYSQNPNVHMEIEYHCHAEYNAPPHTAFAYIPIVKN